MIDGMDFALVFEHHHLILQITREIQVRFHQGLRPLRWRVLGDAEGSASGSDAVGVRMQTQIGEAGLAAHAMPAAASGSGEEGVHSPDCVDEAAWKRE